MDPNRLSLELFYDLVWIKILVDCFQERLQFHKSSGYGKTGYKNVLQKNESTSNYCAFSHPQISKPGLQQILQIRVMNIPPLSESPYPFLQLKPEKVRRTPLRQIVRETPGFLPTFSTDEPKVITRWGVGWGGLQTVKGLKCVIFILNFDYSRHSMVKLIFIPGN